MSSVVISGNTSGTITLAAPDVAGTTTLTLPAVSGTLITSGGGYAGSFTTLTSTQDATLATSSGNVGVGTASPGYKLSVANSAATGNIAYFSTTTGVPIYIASYGSTGGIFSEPASNNGWGLNASSNYITAFTNGSERLRIASAGQIGIGGANYGTSGQVLTSGGSGAAPSWTTVSSSPTTAQVLSATAGASVGEVGTYAFLVTTATFNPGDNITGSNLRYSCVYGTSYNQTANTGTNYGSTISGTWKAMGYTNVSQYNITVFLRVS